MGSHGVECILLWFFISLKYDVTLFTNVIPQHLRCIRYIILYSAYIHTGLLCCFSHVILQYTARIYKFPLSCFYVHITLFSAYFQLPA